MSKKGVVLAFVATLLMVSPSNGQDLTSAYPNRQVRLVIPYPPGGPTDLIGRILAQRLGERLGQSFLVENISGASGAVGAGRVARAAPDGYTLLVTTNDYAVASVTNKNLSYDPIKDFSPVMIIAASPKVIAANPSFPARTMKEMIDVINAAPDKYSYASLGVGFGQLSAVRLFKLGLKLDKLIAVPFNGAAPAVTSTLAGDTQLIFSGIPPITPYLKSNSLRAIAVTSPQRSDQFPDVPTLTESGVPNQDSEIEIGLVAPAGTPAPIIAKLQNEISEIVKVPDVRSIIETASFHVVASTPAQYASQIKDDIALWSRVMKDANIPVN